LTGFALRRALPALVGVLTVLVGVGLVAVVLAGLPLWLPFGFALLLMGVQYAIAPWLMERLIPAEPVLHDGTRYLTEHPLGEILARRCNDAGIPLVTLGIVQDGNPNAFTFGHHRGDARIWVTTGLLERLDLAEVDAVIAHEVAHVKNNDVLLMTAAAAVPLGLYFLYTMMRSVPRDEVANAAVVAYGGYLLSELFVLALSRARESTADHWSCATTGNGAALASALVKISYGMGEVRAAEREQLLALRDQGKEGKQATRRLQRQSQRVKAMSVMGIADPRQGSSTSAILQAGLAEPELRAAMRWELQNPWGRLLEKLSSHPLTARRIDELAASGLPGAPRGWGDVVGEEARRPAPEAKKLFPIEVAVMVAPWGVLLLSLAALDGMDLGLGLVAAGVLFFVKQLVRYPTDFRPVDRCTSLLTRMDASPMQGIPVSLRGRIVGRGIPGYVLSADLCVQDASGFLTLLYRQPLPFWGGLFALFKAERFMGQEVAVRGWYRRGPGPYLEIRDVVATGVRTKCFEWVVRYVAAGVLMLIGAVVVLGAL